MKINEKRTTLRLLSIYALAAMQFQMLSAGCGRAFKLEIDRTKTEEQVPDNVVRNARCVSLCRWSDALF